VLVQFEDFESTKASPLLEKYRHKFRCFNDDIQGTGCVTLAGVVAAARQANTPLTEMSFLCAGAGSAGLGVCAQIVDGMVEAGLPREEAMKRFVICTSIGALARFDLLCLFASYRALRRGLPPNGTCVRCARRE
jgi:malic enzyme